jgi:hypothetical protein
MSINLFISYLPCQVEAGIDPRAARREGLIVDDVVLGWKDHVDKTGMTRDFTYLWDFFNSRSCTTDLFMFHKENLPKTCEETPSNMTHLRNKISMCSRYDRNFISLLGHGHSECGSLGMIKHRGQVEKISPTTCFDLIKNIKPTIGQVPWLFLLVDSCYSGFWVDHVAMLDDLPVNVVVQASCSMIEDAYGGLFTPVWLYLQRLSDHDLGNLLAEFQLNGIGSTVVVEQHPLLFIKANGATVGATSTPVELVGGFRFIADPDFFQFLVGKLDIQCFGERPILPSKDAIDIIGKLLNTKQLHDFKLFTLKNGALDISVLFEVDFLMYILHVHYEAQPTLGTVSIGITATVFTARNPVQDESHTDFTGSWNSGRWGKEAPTIFKEDRTQGKPGKFLKDKSFDVNLDKLLRKFVDCQTNDPQYFDSVSNWRMTMGYCSKMRSRSVGAKMMWPTPVVLDAVSGGTDGKLGAQP